MSADQRSDAAAEPTHPDAQEPPDALLASARIDDARQELNQSLRSLRQACLRLQGSLDELDQVCECLDELDLACALLEEAASAEHPSTQPEAPSQPHP